MKPIVSLAVSCLVSLCCVPSGMSAPPEGPAVLLRSGQVMYGNARQDGDHVIIEADHSTIRLSKREVACWGDSIASLYQYRIDRRPPDSLQHHLDDAKWCLENGLYANVTEELETVQKIAGRIPEAEAIKKRLVMAKEREAEAEARASKGIQQTGGTRLGEIPSNEHPEALPPQLFSSTSMQRFTSNVQPLLINRCATAGCHGSRPTASPHLEGWRFGTTPTITTRNLQELGRLIDPRQPLESRLWKMATTPHGGSAVLSGGADQLLRDRLQEWIQITAGQTFSNAQYPAGASNLQYVPMMPAMSAPPANYTPTSLAPVTVPESPNGTPAQRESNAPQASNNAAPLTPPKKLPDVGDPFDPEIFNRSYR